MKKNILAIFFIVLVTVFCICPISVFAEEAEIAESQVSAEPSDKNAEENPTFLGRVGEFFVDYASEIIGGSSAVITWIFGALVAKCLKKGNDTIVSNINATKATAAETKNKTSQISSSQTSMLSAINALIGESNALNARYQESLGNEEARDDAVNHLTVLCTTVLEILTTVYANSKNLPQGAKDIVSLKYAKCLKAISGVVTDTSVAEGEAEEANEASTETLEA